jgi:hypothetical protein
MKSGLFNTDDGELLGFSAEVDASDFERATGEMAKRSRNMRPWFGVFMTVFQVAHEIHFTGQGSLGRVSGKWKVPYSKKYKKQKAAKYGHLKKEFASNKMYNSLTSFTPSTLKTVTSDSITMGTQARAKRKSGNFYYPATQQFGAKTKLGQHREGARKKRPSEKKMKFKARIPPRPPMITNWPGVITTGLTDSMLEYITTGRVRMPRF